MAEAPEVYGDFFKDEYESQLTRKVSLEARGIAIVTTSGALVTLLFGLAAVTTKAEDWRPPLPVLLMLMIALALFCLAAFAGLRANVLVTTHVLKADILESLRTTRWSDSEADARSTIAYARIRATGELRRLNNKKAKHVSLGLGAQLGALIVLGVAVFFVLLFTALA